MKRIIKIGEMYFEKIRCNQLTGEPIIDDKEIKNTNNFYVLLNNDGEPVFYLRRISKKGNIISEVWDE